MVCGSENGELLFWRDGKAVVPPTVPQVRGGDRGTRRGGGGQDGYDEKCSMKIWCGIADIYEMIFVKVR